MAFVQRSQSSGGLLHERLELGIRVAPQGYEMPILSGGVLTLTQAFIDLGPPAMRGREKDQVLCTVLGKAAVPAQSLA